MTRLSESEKQQLKSPRPGKSPQPAPAVKVMSPAAYMEFATLAARFDRSVKPVRFEGAHWKL
jgi:hypothetical protein